VGCITVNHSLLSLLALRGRPPSFIRSLLGRPSWTSQNSIHSTSGDRVGKILKVEANLENLQRILS
jgi:hypothetical protein